MTDDAVDDFGVGEKRDGLHFFTAFTKEWVYFEDFSDQECPELTRFEVDGMER